MSVDFPPPAVQPPSLLLAVLSRVGSGLFTAAAGVLVTAGVISNSQATQLVSILLALVTWGAGWGWAEYVAYLHRENTKALVAQAKAP